MPGLGYLVMDPPPPRGGPQRVLWVMLLWFSPQKTWLLEVKRLKDSKKKKKFPPREPSGQRLGRVKQQAALWKL